MYRIYVLWMATNRWGHHWAAKRCFRRCNIKLIHLTYVRRQQYRRNLQDTSELTLRLHNFTVVGEMITHPIEKITLLSSTRASNPVIIFGFLSVVCIRDYLRKYGAQVHSAVSEVNLDR
jgi:hypothetical protein